MASETIANGTDKLIHELDLDEFGLDQVPEDDQARVKQDVADFLEEEILRDVANGTSPVQGEGKFKRLDKDYAKAEKHGVRISNLELEGDLLTDFFVRSGKGSKVILGHNGGEVPKSDGHNQLSAKAKKWAKKSGHPKRRYVPDDSQQFKKKIRDGISRIIDDNIVVPTTEPGETTDIDLGIGDVQQGIGEITGGTVSVGVEDLFSDDSIEAFLGDALRRSGRG